jgi:hypothetical protein
MTRYVNLLSRKPGDTDWSRRQSFGCFGEGNVDVRPREAAENKAALAAITWQRQEPDTEFRIAVTDTPWH